MMWLLWLGGCLVSEEHVLSVLDQDGDGHLHEDADGGDDCDDRNPDVAPGLPEVCGNGVDDDCDGAVDDDGVGAIPVYADADGDGHGDDARAGTGCAVEEGEAAVGGDCNDADGAARPGGVEVCNGRDDDCDGAVDDGAAAASWYLDGDGDGYGAGEPQPACDAPGPDWRMIAGDCDDARADVFPGAVEARYDGVDADCAGDDDFDADGDGARERSFWPEGPLPPDALVDCDDGDPRRAPQLPEVWYDGADQDCNPQTEWDQDADGVALPPEGEDCDDLNAAVGAPLSWWPDADADGWGDPGGEVVACAGPAFHVRREGDCDDGEPEVHAGAAEACNEVDDDCDGVVDEGLRVPAWPDADLDGFGDDATPAREVCAPGPREVGRGGDCDDRRPDVNVVAPERCDAVDNDCDGWTDEEVRVEVWPDRDGDGRGDEGALPEARCEVPVGFVVNALDCDDTQTTVHRGATEVCDGLDNDCDGTTDEGLLIPVWPDRDLDGWGDAFAAEVMACHPDADEATVSGDCDDAQAGVRPLLAEACDGLDNDCDGGVDDGLLVEVWPDADLDGFGDGLQPSRLACDWAAGWTAVAGDCDDASQVVFPANVEVCDGFDNDCDGAVDDGLLTEVWPDRDRDGFGDDVVPPTLMCAWTSSWATVAGDCDDGSAARWPGNPEVCDGLDNDCDAGVDDGLLFRVWPDLDQDGWGDGGAGWAEVCVLRPLQSGVPGDCDDSQATVWPGFTESCDGLDNDCDGVVDDGVQTWFWPDADGDLRGDADAAPVAACARPVGFAADDRDCDDANADVHRDHPEVCDGLDNDCDLVADEGVTVSIYADRDRDTFGDAASGVREVCAPGDQQAMRAGDCDDRDATRNPTAFEICDGRDQNCDGVVDNGMRTTLWPDLDLDGYGDARAAGAPGCPALGRAPNGQDCDDGNAEVRPGVGEVCDGADDDCDGQIDEGVQVQVWPDVDQDGWGAQVAPALGCPAVGWVQRSGDCADRNPTRNPGATELCDAIDQDCDGSAENGLGYSGFRDWDGDGYGDPNQPVTSCDPGQVVGVAGDCDDRQPLANPGEVEVCDGVDNDCDRTTDEGVLIGVWRDRDADGWGDDATFEWRCEVPPGGVTADGDCQDGDPLVHPAADEVCDGLDNDCSGLIDDGGYLAWFLDLDQDGYGAGPPAFACAPPAPGMATVGGDCEDAVGHAHPGAAEAVCDGVDDDCDGSVDEELLLLVAPDADGDGFGDGARAARACALPDGWSFVMTDCDDTRATINPQMIEGPGLCDGLDNDCNPATPWDTAATCGAVAVGVRDGSWYGLFGSAPVPRQEEFSFRSGAEQCAAIGAHLIIPDGSYGVALFEIPAVAALLGGPTTGMYATGITFDCQRLGQPWWGYAWTDAPCTPVPAGNLPPGFGPALEGSPDEDYTAQDPDPDLVDNGDALIGHRLGALAPGEARWVEQEPRSYGYIICERELP